MPSKNKILLMERLKTRKGRPREGLVLVEGVRCVREALAAEVKGAHKWAASAALAHVARLPKEGEHNKDPVALKVQHIKVAG